MTADVPVWPRVVAAALADTVEARQFASATTTTSARRLPTTGVVAAGS